MALYQNDAATRVIARVTRERDEAREALSSVTIGGVNEDSMQVDNQEFSEELAAKVLETSQRYVFLVPNTWKEIWLTGTGSRTRAVNDRFRKAGRPRKSLRHSNRHRLRIRYTLAAPRCLLMRLGIWHCLVALMVSRVSTRYHKRRSCMP